MICGAKFGLFQPTLQRRTEDSEHFTPTAQERHNKKKKKIDLDLDLEDLLPRRLRDTHVRARSLPLGCSPLS